MWPDFLPDLVTVTLQEKPNETEPGQSGPISLVRKANNKPTSTEIQPAFSFGRCWTGQWYLKDKETHVYLNCLQWHHGRDINYIQTGIYSTHFTHFPPGQTVKPRSNGRISKINCFVLGLRPYLKTACKHKAEESSISDAASVVPEFYSTEPRNFLLLAFNYQRYNFPE